MMREILYALRERVRKIVYAGDSLNAGQLTGSPDVSCTISKRLRSANFERVDVPVVE